MNRLRIQATDFLRRIRSGVREPSAKMSHLHVGLSPETTEKARLELNENPDTLHQDIQQVLGTHTRRVGISIDFPFDSFTAKLVVVGLHWFLC